MSTWTIFLLAYCVFLVVAGFANLIWAGSRAAPLREFAIAHFAPNPNHIYEANHNISERLLLDIWTNGSISPKEAFESASKIIIDLFTLLIQNKNINENNKDNSKPKSINLEPYTNIAIEELQLSVRAYNCLKKAQINTIGDLLQYSPEQLQELKNFGRKSADEVFFTLKNKLGISLEL